jgi:hypothetical protein
MLTTKLGGQLALTKALLAQAVRVVLIDASMMVGVESM